MSFIGHLLHHYEVQGGIHPTNQLCTCIEVILAASMETLISNIFYKESISGFPSDVLWLLCLILCHLQDFLISR